MSKQGSRNTGVALSWQPYSFGFWDLVYMVLDPAFGFPMEVRIHGVWCYCIWIEHTYRGDGPWFKDIVKCSKDGIIILRRQAFLE